MRTVLILTLGVVFFGCSDDSRPVFGSGEWRFHDVSLLNPTCQVEDVARTITGEHGDESPSGGSLVVKCRATKLDGGDLIFNLRLEDDGAADLVDIRALRIPGVYLTGTSPHSALPSRCESVYFEVSGAQYQAVCTTDEPLEGECQLIGATLDEAASSISVEFSCHAVPTLGGGSSTCEVSGGGTSAIATLSFDGCSGF
jgi:hypothetical protein